MKRLVLIRLKKMPDRTLGRLLLFSGIWEFLSLASLELPWENNARNKSAIPIGRYVVEPRSSEKHGDHLLVCDVPGRESILIHAGNRPSDTEGCILVGLRNSDIDGDGKMDVAASKSAMTLLTQFVREPVSLVVIDA